MEEIESIIFEVVEGLLDGASTAGGLLGPAGLAAASGAAFGARFHRLDQARETLTLTGSEENGRRRVEDALSRRLKAFRHGHVGAKTVMAGTLGSGFLNLNPTACLVVLESAGDGDPILEIRTFAREGWINQKSAPRAAQKLKSFLAQA